MLYPDYDVNKMNSRINYIRQKAAVHFRHQAVLFIFEYIPEVCDFKNI